MFRYDEPKVWLSKVYPVRMGRLLTRQERDGHSKAKRIPWWCDSDSLQGHCWDSQRCDAASPALSKWEQEASDLQTPVSILQERYEANQDVIQEHQVKPKT